MTKKLAKYQVGSSSQSAITVGTINSIFLNKDELIPQTSRKPAPTELTKLISLLPIQRFSNLIPNIQNKFKSVHLEQRINAQMNYYKAQYFDSQVDDQILSELLTEADQYQFDQRLNNHSSNLLLHFQYKALHYLSIVQGETRNRLEIYSLIQHDRLQKINTLVDVYEFSTPITQLKSANQNVNVIYVRTFKGIHSIRLGRPEYETYSTHRFLKEPVHISVSNVLKNQSAVVLNDGEILVYDATKEYTKLNIQNDSDQYFCCEYASHPRSLLLGSESVVDLLDLRSMKRSKIHQTKDIHSFELNPLNIFHLALATSTHTKLIDTRYTKYPLLQWSLNNRKESKTNLFFNNDSFYTWGRVHSEIIEYTYIEKDDLPPVATNIQMYPSYYEHDIYANPCSSMMKPFMLDFMYPPSMLDNQELIPSFATLEGVCVVDLHKGFSIFQMNDQGQVFVQGFSNTNDERDSIDDWIESVEAKCIDEIKTKCSQELEKNEECNHEILDFGPLIKDINEKLEAVCISENMESSSLVDSIDEELSNLYDVAKQKTISNDDIPTLLCNQTQVQELIEMAQAFKNLDLSTFNGTHEQIINTFPQPQFEFSGHIKDLAQEYIKQDVALWNTMIIPKESSYKVLQYGDHIKHSSILTSTCFENPLELKGMSSWLLDKWDQPDEDPEDPVVGTPKKRVRQSSSVKSTTSEPVIKRNEVFTRQRSFTGEESPSVMTQPIVSRSSVVQAERISNSLPMNMAKKIIKRKKGF